MFIIAVMKSRDIIRLIEADGWLLKRVTGSHHHYAHPDKPGIVTVPHPNRDIPIGTVRSFEKQAGIKLR
jgi:predicted RNA binding protein YcfA (HicA-like mRNA interferase family)